MPWHLRGLGQSDVASACRGVPPDQLSLPRVTVQRRWWPPFWTGGEGLVVRLRELGVVAAVLSALGGAG